MSDMKCPFCQQELRKRHAATTDFNSMFITYCCGNPECESTTDLIGCKEFWDILGQLIRIRKALDVAVDALGYYASENSWDETNRWMFVENGFEFAKDVLEQITALTKGTKNE